TNEERNQQNQTRKAATQLNNNGETSSGSIGLQSKTCQYDRKLVTPCQDIRLAKLLSTQAP
ncbi:unnamed protein product, partial [Musa acuminata subsp. burmannicoides]